MLQVLVLQGAKYRKNSYPLRIGVMTVLSYNSTYCVSEANNQLFLKIAVVKTKECFAVAGFVASHLVNSVVNSVQAQFLSALSKVCLAHGCAVFRLDAHLQVGCGAVRHHFAQKFGKFCSVFCLFVSMQHRQLSTNLKLKTRASSKLM